jgi:hypothetical protein
MVRHGRPPTDLKKDILDEISQDKKRLIHDLRTNDVVVREKLRDGNRSWQMAFVAARVLLTLERGNEYQKARCEPIIRQLRKWAQVKGPHGVWPNDSDFLTCLIERHAPGWKWREQIDDDNVRVKQFAAAGQPDARRVCLSWQCMEKLRRIVPTHPADWATLPGEIYYGGSRSRNEQIAKERTSMKRHDEARVNRFVTAEPDAGMLYDLRRIIPTDPTTWPTLRELKLATGIQERTIKTIIANLRPTPTQAEIVTIPLRHMFSRRGAMPRRHGPALVIGVLNEFVNRLSQFPIANEDQKRLREIAMRARAGIASRFSRSRSST